MSTRRKLPEWFTNPKWLQDEMRRDQSLWIWTVEEIQIALAGWNVMFLTGWEKGRAG